uniref:GTP-binding protein YPTC5 (Trinotate prediction) n=1 Tax=Henneguya salminicola TaxID=69463 RepID=A0A6G3MJ03_HENSL
MLIFYSYLKIIDTAGVEKYAALTNNYYRGADAVVLCFDITNLTSFERIDRWRNDFLVASNPPDPNNYPFFLASTKNDLESKIVDETRISRWCDNKIPYMETSAKKDIGVKELFELIAEEFVKREPKEESNIPAIPDSINLSTSYTSETKTGCC